MSYPLYVVDSFTNRHFGGNQAGVCVLPSAKDSEWMQNVAAEVNLAETAFVYPDSGAYHLKWFSPTVEVALCGHATLAAAHILWQTMRLPEVSPAEFDTLSGRLTAVKNGEWINLNFPSTPAEEKPIPAGVVEAVGVTPVYVGLSCFDVLMEVATEQEVFDATPDFAKLLTVPNIRGVILTAESSSNEFDFVSRFFAPAFGINEDPATGSSHCCLSPHWSAKLGRNELIARQLSRRGGIIRTTYLGPRVQIAGQAITFSSGELLA